jgi:hypothetical protein
MSELRQDRTTGGRVIIAPQRGGRPQMHGLGARPQKRPRFDPSCPSCPGHEAQLAGLIDERPAHGVPGWSVRIIPNKFPALQLEQETPLAGNDHECCPNRRQLSAFTGSGRATLLSQDCIAATILFRNYGRWPAPRSCIRIHTSSRSTLCNPRKIIIFETERRYATAFRQRVGENRPLPRGGRRGHH